MPAIPAFQSTNVVQSVTLPPIEPSTLSGANQFTISVVQDADFLTQPIYPQVADQGAGLDQGPIGIVPGPAGTAQAGNLPDLAPATVVVSQSSLNWGQSFQVGAVIQNVGLGNAGQFTVRFIATGVAGDLTPRDLPGRCHGQRPGGELLDQRPDHRATPLQAPLRDVPGQPRLRPDLRRGRPRRCGRAVVAVEQHGVVGPGPPVGRRRQRRDHRPHLSGQHLQHRLAASQAAKTAKTTKVTTPVLGAAKPAGTKVPKKKHKVDFLASVSESVTSTVEKQFKALPDNVNKLLKRIGVSLRPGA